MWPVSFNPIGCNFPQNLELAGDAYTFGIAQELRQKVIVHNPDWQQIAFWFLSCPLSLDKTTEVILYATTNPPVKTIEELDPNVHLTLLNVPLLNDEVLTSLNRSGFRGGYLV